MSLIDHASVPHVALDYMNEDHAAFATTLNDLDDRIEGCDVASVTTLLDDLLHHTREHFAREESDMRKFRFPPYPVHKSEHDRLIAEMEDVVEQWNATHDLPWLRNYLANRLGPWFLQHGATMDLVTARYVAMHKYSATA